MTEFNKKIQVIIVDDELPIREWLKLTMESLNHIIEVVGLCKSGDEALNIIKNNDIDICFTDIKMPSMNGIELLSIVKKIKPQVNFVMLTSHNDFEYVRKSLEFNANEYILKSEITKEMIIRIIKKFYNSSITNVKKTVNKDFLLKYVSHNDKEDLKKSFENIEETTFPIAVHFVNDDDISKVVDCIGYELDNYELTGIHLYDKNTLIILVRFFNRKSKVDMYNAILHVTKLISGTLNKSVGVGEPFEPDKEIYEIIYSSIISLGATYYSKNITCVIYNLDLKPKKEVNRIFFKYRTTIIEHIKNYNIKNLTKLFDEFFDYICTKKYPDIENVKLLCADSINYIGLSQIDNDKKASTYHSYIDHIMYVYHIKEIREIMGDFLDENIYISDDINTNSRYINKTIIYIKERYSSLENISEIANYLSLNLEYLCRLFKAETGSTINNYITEYRMKIACKLLKETELSVNDIAGRIGYNSLSYFSRVFTKQVGKSPYKYRNELVNIVTEVKQ